MWKDYWIPPTRWGQWYILEQKRKAFERNKVNFTTKVVEVAKTETLNTLTAWNYQLIADNVFSHEWKDEKETIKNLLNLKYFSLLRLKIPFNKISNSIDDDTQRLLNHLWDILVKIYRNWRNFRDWATLLRLKDAAKEVTWISWTFFYENFIKWKTSD